MNNQNCLITPAKRKRLEVQGYKRFTDSELNDFTFGIRFAYFLCGSIVAVGLLMTNIQILAAAFIIALFGAILPRHPFDYLYNNIFRHFINKPEMPPRPNQGRFACGIATVWLSGTIYLFYTGLHVWGYIVGGILVMIAGLVSTTDICIPSIIYNFLFIKKK